MERKVGGRMPKSRIYEIAQELNKTNKEVIEFLKEKKVEVKSHMSTLEEKDEKMVRDAFTGKNEGKEEKKEAADRPKKKSNLIQVFRPQNAQTQDCLLYTSPSPRDGLLSRMPSSA